MKITFYENGLDVTTNFEGFLTNLIESSGAIFSCNNSFVVGDNGIRYNIYMSVFNPSQMTFKIFVKVG
jgi:hypothetical protein